eukprot:3781266-Rhodomonas_salina.1
MQRAGILAFYAKERTDARINLHGEAQTLVDLKGRMRHFELEVNPQPTFKVFQEALVRCRRDNVRIIHLAGHGDKEEGFYLPEDTAGLAAEA